MKFQVIIISIILITYFVPQSFCQEVTQNIRGVVVDKDSRVPLPDASLVIVDSDPQSGTTTDHNGEFVFNSIAVGRYDLMVYYVGYEAVTISNVLLSSGKETILFIELTESVIELGEVVFEVEENKSEAINKMAIVSAKKLNVEEAGHVAGSFDDAGRMVSSFAGVTVNPGGTNDIIIRGNSPRGMIWRLEGLDIPNPNHYAEEGSSSGGISILNGAVLANSDFFTGAFPAEYGNAYSGVFNMTLRNGNNHKREYILQAGFKGVDATLEGPFSKKSRSSYLFNYRYSTLAVLRAIGINLYGDAVPDFQDITFKIKVPTKKMGVFTFFGIGGISKVQEEEELFTNDYQTNMVVFGIKNLYFINPSTYITSIFAYTGSKNLFDYKKPDSINTFITRATDKYIYQTPKISLTLNKKFDARNVLKAGVVSNFIGFNLLSDRYNYELDELITEVNHSGSTVLLQSFVNWKHRFNERFTLIAGLHNLYLVLNKEYTIEPRLALKWQLNSTQSLNLGLGLHSKMESLATYYAQITLTDGSVVQPNENLGFSKAGHIVFGYENMLTESLFLNVEIYYQHLFEIPVEDSLTSSFSILNFNSGQTNRSLVNTGIGRNVGVEITLERYFSQNYYFMSTASLFDSRYKAMDNKDRNTRYNGNYVLNALAGKDFILGKNQKKRILSLNMKFTWAGGQRATPIDVEQSEIQEYTIRDEKNAFSEQWPDFFRIDFKVSLSRNRKKATHTIELDIQNITNQLNVSDNYYDPDSGQIKTITQMGFVPIFNYKVVF